MPDASWPPARDGQLEAVYQFSAGAPRIFRVPSSDEELTVLQLVADPPVVTERYVDGERIWIAPPDLDVLHVRCAYRLWGRTGAADPFGAAAPIADRFPGAVILSNHADEP